MHGSVLSEPDVVELEVIDLTDPGPRGLESIVDPRSFEERYATLAFGLGTVPRRQHADDSIWQRPAGLLIGVGGVLSLLMLLSTAH